MTWSLRRTSLVLAAALPGSTQPTSMPGKVAPMVIRETARGRTADFLGYDLKGPEETPNGRVWTLEVWVPPGANVEDE